MILMIRAALILSTRLQIKLQGLIFQGGLASFGVAAGVIEGGELAMSNCTVRDVRGAQKVLIVQRRGEGREHV